MARTPVINYYRKWKTDLTDSAKSGFVAEASFIWLVTKCMHEEAKLEFPVLSSTIANRLRGAPRSLAD